MLVHWFDPESLSGHRSHATCAACAKLAQQCLLSSTPKHFTLTASSLLYVNAMHSITVGCCMSGLLTSSAAVFANPFNYLQQHQSRAIADDKRRVLPKTAAADSSNTHSFPQSAHDKAPHRTYLHPLFQSHKSALQKALNERQTKADTNTHIQLQGLLSGVSLTSLAVVRWRRMLGRSQYLSAATRTPHRLHPQAAWRTLVPVPLLLSD